MKKISLLVLLFAIAISCKKGKETTKLNDETKQITEITIEKLTDSPSYTEAVLQLKKPSNTKNIKNGAVDFQFEVANYELGAQTDSPNATILANSGKGQHIHFILNNQPYSAHYTPNFTKELPSGTHHLVAFLSRSYHESVKNKNSVVFKKFEVGENPKDTIGIDVSAPTLIYSRPKGTYKGKDTNALLLDFFVLNTSLSENGNKVKATINGKEFIITEWVPQVVKGLPKGEITIELELIDADGNFIDGPFNKVKRTVTLED
ncbi:hypothetical protein [Polaribacter sp.]|uniref:hypothetical protein n=1 Tax=Polaribacter sp. TaxID=1920175 RepID=UPI0025D602F6|nr:hypothetical protein [Polaribacter sp.]